MQKHLNNLAGTSQCTNNDKQNSESNFSKSNLIKEQQNDPEISVLYQKAPDELDTAEDPVCYFIKDGVLMRKNGDLQMFQLMKNGLLDIKLLFLSLTDLKFLVWHTILLYQVI